jgi:hypothetical protein
MRILNLVCLSVILLPLSELAATAYTTEAKINSNKSPIEEGRSTKAEGRRFRSDGDLTSPERELLNLRSVGVLNPCSLRSRAEDRSQNSLLPSASCPLPFPNNVVRKADFVSQNQWKTKASSLLAQTENQSSANSQDRSQPKDIADNPWSNTDPEKEKDSQEVLSELQKISQQDFAPYRGAPGFTMANPYGFGADSWNPYVGIGFTPNSRNGSNYDLDDADGIIGFGIGLGNARKAVGLELNYTMAGFGENRDFGTGGFSTKIHRTVANGWGVALGWNGFLNLGDENDFQDSIYFATTKIFSTKEKLNSPLSRIAVTIGAGNGQFRTEEAIEDDKDTFNPFGSVALRIARPISGVVEWTGQDLAVGTSISPFKTIPVTFNLGLRDIAGAGDGARFVMGVGAGF